MEDVPLVLWAFSRPGDLNFDAFIIASSSEVLGSNRKAVVKRLGSCFVQSSSVGFILLLLRLLPAFGIELA